MAAKGNNIQFCLIVFQQVDVEMDPPIFITKHMSNEKMGEI